MSARSPRNNKFIRFATSFIRGVSSTRGNTNVSGNRNRLVGTIRSNQRLFQLMANAIPDSNQNTSNSTSGSTENKKSPIVQINGLLRSLLRDEIQAKRDTENEILQFAREGERSTRNAEEFRQEYTRNRVRSTTGILGRSGKRMTKGLLEFLRTFIFSMLKYKIFDWISKPENTRLITGTFKFLFTTVKFFGFLYKTLSDKVTPIIEKTTAGITLYSKYISTISDILTFRWLRDPEGMTKSLSEIPKLLIESVPKLMMGLVNSMVGGLFGSIPKFIQQSIEDFFKNLFRPQETYGSIPPVDTKTVELDIPKVKVEKKKETPQLRSGGIVGPIAEKGKEVTVKPLDKITEYSGISGVLKKTVKAYMDLLTIPFKIIGVGLISLVTNVVSGIPGISYILKPFLSNIVSSFNLPQSILNFNNVPNPFGDLTKPKSRTQPKPKQSIVSDNSGSPSSPGGGDSAGPSGPIPPGTQLKLEELRKLASEAGFDDREARIMAAIAMAESGGKSSAHNPDRSTGDNSYGLWQINMIDDLGVERRRDLGLKSNEDLFDPKINARAAKYIRDRQGLSAWSVYKNGLHKPYLDSMKSKGGWIHGPKSGYPVSLDGGNSVSFIGHGTEWVGRKGKEAFVVPFDTPDTDRDSKLVHRRYKEAANAGFPLPYSRGGKVRPPQSTTTERLATQGRTNKAGTGGLPAVISAGQFILKKGFTVYEHPNFVNNKWSQPGPNNGVGYTEKGNARVGRHSAGSLHYSGLALDIADWRNGDYIERTKGLAEFMYQNRARFRLTQIIFDPWGHWFGGAKSNRPYGGHDSHLHLGFASGPGAELDGLDYNSSGGSDGTGAQISPKEDNPLSGQLMDHAKYLYQLLTGQGESSSASMSSPLPKSSQLKDIKNQDIVDIAYNKRNMSPNSPTLINQTNSSVTKSSTNLYSNSLGMTLPMDGSWSIFKINI